MGAEVEDVIRIPNHHVPSCGALPSWVRERDGSSTYFGYFENQHGEQWVFLAGEGFAQLAGGDLGWEQVHRLERPNWHDPDDWLVMKADLDTNEFQKPWPGIVLDDAESTWLTAAVRAASQRFTLGGYAPRP